MPNESGGSHTDRSEIDAGDSTDRTKSGLDTQRTTRSQQSMDDNDTMTDDSEQVETNNLDSSARRRRRKKQTSRNGINGIDMTPPDRLLRHAERRAKKYMEKKKASSAIKELIRCTALARIVYRDGHWKLASSYVNLAQGYFDLKGYAAQTEYHCETAIAILRQSVQPAQSSTDRPKIREVFIRAYYNMARALGTLKKYQAAEQALTKAENIFHEWIKLPQVSEDDMETTEIQLSLASARLNARQEKFPLATSYYEKVLDLTKRRYGNEAIQLIPVYQGLGRVEQSKGKHADHETAIEYYLQAHTIASANKSLSITYKHTPLLQLSKSLSITYKHTPLLQAESYLNECLTTYQVKCGPNSEKTLRVQDELARLMVRSDRQPESIKMLRSTIEAKSEVYGDLSPEVADTWKLIGSIHLSQGDTEKGLRCLKKCYNIECLVYGTNSRKTKDTQRTIDLLLANPTVASKHKKGKGDDIKNRPRFNSIVNTSTVGAHKSQMY
ncbi:hypothetical protein NP493_407g05026 [Ridgeia piscesae]|uniref:Tetratricopeptide repeat n=1 Tax=Ridgeia piscesae TaxID=27915 RepID=A0AAD9L0V1_RIDPI|nr:hypothetical protein NP493_407g05026 [Ridgeia piscesae]